MLIENEEIINESTKVANVFNPYFESVTESLDLLNLASDHYDQAKDPFERIMHRFLHHPSVIKTSKTSKFRQVFLLQQ